MKTSAARQQSAFTMVEILIAIGILGLVIAAIYSSWTAILRASKVGMDAAATAQRARIAVRTLEDSLASAESFQLGQRYYGFLAENGTDASLSFVARLAKSFPRGGKFGDLDVRRVTFSVEPGPDSSSQLVLRQTPLLMDPDSDADERDHPLVLARNVKEFELEFWDTRLNDWVDEWKQTNQLPKAVKVILRLTDNSRSHGIEQITRIVSVAANAVPPGWQLASQQPGAPGTPPVPTPPRGPEFIPPTQPGGLPIINPNLPKTR
jgi:type II secretion system protein J